MATYRLAALAQLDLEDVFNYTTERWSLEQANIYDDTLLDIFDLLATNPGIGRPLLPSKPGILHYPVGSHHIIYQLEQQYILILRILHQRMNPDNHLS